MSDTKRVLVGRRYVDNEIRHLRERMEARWEADRVALAVAVHRAEDKATGVERGLDELNRAHARALQAQALTVSRESHDLQIAALNKRIDTQGTLLWAVALAVAGMVLTVAGWLVIQ